MNKIASDPATGSIHTTGRRKAFVDGSNILLGLLESGRPSVSIFAHVVAELSKREFDVFSFFDQSIRYHLEQRRCHDEWQKLQALVDASDGRITLHVQADPHLLSKAAAYKGERAVVVNTTDRYRTWTSQFPGGLPAVVRVSYAAELLSFHFEDRSLQPFSVHVDKEISLYGMSVRGDRSTVSEQEGTMTTETILVGKKRTRKTMKSRLIVFLLDGSGSMCNPSDGAENTFDGKQKSEHLQNVFRETVVGLNKSNASGSFYCGLVCFAGKPTVVEMSGSKMVHISHLNSHISQPSFNYVALANGDGTDLSAALDSAVSLIDAVLAAPDNKYIATEWSAVVIMITDAHDTVDEQKVRKTVAQLGLSRAHLTSGRIDVGCVGIGTDVKQGLLTEIASKPSSRTMQMLSQAQLQGRLLTRGNGEQCLAIKVDTLEPHYDKVIRSFVDIVSSRVNS